MVKNIIENTTRSFCNVFDEQWHRFVRFKSIKSHTSDSHYNNLQGYIEMITIVFITKITNVKERCLYNPRPIKQT